MPETRIDRAANAVAEPPRAINGRRALQECASRRHWLPACHLSQPDTASTRPSVNTAGSVGLGAAEPKRRRRDESDPKDGLSNVALLLISWNEHEEMPTDGLFYSHIM